MPIHLNTPGAMVASACSLMNCFCSTGSQYSGHLSQHATSQSSTSLRSTGSIIGKELPWSFLARHPWLASKRIQEKAVKSGYGSKPLMKDESRWMQEVASSPAASHFFSEKKQALRQA